MTPLLKNLLGNGSKDRELAEELRAILQEAREERGRVEALLESSRTAADRLRELGEPIARAGSEVDAVSARLGELQQRFETMAQLSARLLALDELAEGLGRSQQLAETRIADTIEEAQRIRSSYEELGRRVDLALDLKDRLETFLEVDKPFQILKGDADALRGQLEGTAEHLARLREQHDRLLDAHKLGMSKMEALDRRRDELGRDLQDKERRVASVEQSVRGMDGVQSTVGEIKREMGTLKALGEFVAQKTAALEAQREAVENALARADQLDRAMRQVDAGVRQQQENERSLSAMQDQVAGLRSLHEAVLERSGEISELQRETDEQARAARQELALMRDETRKTLERFDFENRGLESVSQRVADLRGALSDFENRFKGLSEAGQTVGQLRVQTQTLTAQLQTIAQEVGEVGTETAKLQAIRRDLDQMSQTSRDAGDRVARIEEARPAVEAALRDLEELRGTHEMVKDALEQTRLSREEIGRALQSQTETRSWLAGVEGSVGELAGQVGDLLGMAPTIDAVQKQAERVGESMGIIESRRDFVEDLHRRTAEFGALCANLDERGADLQARMEAAEQRFVGLAGHAEEADRLSRAMAAVTASVEKAQRGADRVGKKVTGIEARCESVEGLAERTRVLREELDQRQHALEEAAEELRRASEARKEAAAAGQKLGDLAKRLGVELSSADQRAGQIDKLATQLEDRAADLRSVETRLDQFEERMARWDLVEQDVARSLEQFSTRQGTVEALQADLERMFVTTEKTSSEVREITSARREIEESHALLQEVMGRLREIQEMASALDERKRQMTKAEQRLARAEALLVDVRSSLEALQGQKAMVDQAVEKTGSLRSMLKQAEIAIGGLREEREMSARVRSAVALVREGDDTGGREDLAKAA